MMFYSLLSTMLIINNIKLNIVYINEVDDKNNLFGIVVELFLYQRIYNVKRNNIKNLTYSNVE